MSGERIKLNLRGTYIETYLSNLLKFTFFESKMTNWNKNTNKEEYLFIDEESSVFHKLLDCAIFDKNITIKEDDENSFHKKLNYYGYKNLTIECIQNHTKYYVFAQKYLKDNMDAQLLKQINKDYERFTEINLNDYDDGTISDRNITVFHFELEKGRTNNGVNNFIQLIDNDILHSTQNLTGHNRYTIDPMYPIDPYVLDMWNNIDGIRSCNFCTNVIRINIGLYDSLDSYIGNIIKITYNTTKYIKPHMNINKKYD